MTKVKTAAPVKNEVAAPAVAAAPADKPLAFRLREHVAQGLEGLKGKTHEEIRVGLGLLAVSTKAIAPAHFGTRAEMEAHKPVLSSDKTKRKEQMTEYKKAKQASRSVIALVDSFAESQGLGERKDDYGWTVYTNGNVAVRHTQRTLIKNAKSAKIVL